MWVQLPPLPLHFTSLNKRKKMIDRLEDQPSCYQKMNISEIFNRIEEINDNFMMNPSQDIDEFLGDAEEVLDLVRVLRAHFGLPNPE
jgi:hypothetical protein